MAEEAKHENYQGEGKSRTGQTPDLSGSKHPAAPRTTTPSKRPRTTSAPPSSSSLAQAFSHVLDSRNYHKTIQKASTIGRATVRTATAPAGSSLLIHPRQRGNPVLKWIRQVTMDASPHIDADFVCGKRTGVLYLSLRFHYLNPGYIYGRVREMGLYEVRVLLVLIDVADWGEGLKELSKLSILRGIVICCADSLKEAGRYLELLRALDSKTADDIRQRVEEGYSARLQRVWSSMRAVNKTDAVTLALNFGKLKNVGNASVEELRACPGFGETKVKRLHAALHQPFLKDSEVNAKESDADE